MRILLSIVSFAFEKPETGVFRVLVKTKGQPSSFGISLNILTAVSVSATSWWRVRRHINWNNQGADLKEDLAQLVQDIKRRICGIASAGSPSFSV